MHEQLSPAVWFPAVTLIVGFLLNSIYSSLGVSRREKREASRRQASFQSSNYLELQEQILELARYASQVYISDTRSANKGNRWGISPVDAEVDQKSVPIKQKISLFRSRVYDENLRRRITEYVECVMLIEMASSHDEALANLNKASEQAASLVEELGEALRALPRI